MNFIDCTFKEEDGNYILDAGAFTLEIERSLGEVIKEKATSEEVILGIRPENVIMMEKPGVKNSIRAEVYVIEPLGSEMIIDLKVNGNIIKAKSSEELKLAIGDKIWIRFDENKIHMFDKKTEKAII